MRKLKVGLSALSFIAGGIMAASAASTPNTGSSAPIFIDFGTNAQRIYYVGGLPVSTDTNSSVSVVFDDVSTDGAGKIEGVAYITISYSSDTNGGATANFIVDVTGSITTKGNPSVATAAINLKGNGYSIDGSGTVNAANLSLKFTGTPNSDNVFAGTLSGTVKLGTKTITGNTSDKVSGAATIDSTESVPFDVFAHVVELNTKFWAAGAMASEFVPFSGTGSVNTKKGSYSANLKGIGAFGRGSSAKLTGTTQVATNGTIIVGSNEVPVTIVIPGTATATGKIIGQKLNATGGVTQIED
jgi:hypothetical protein